MKPPFQDKPIFRKGEVLGELLIRPFQTFASLEASSGVLLLLCAVGAIVWINTGFARAYEELWGTAIRVGFRSWTFDRSLHFWINDGLMTIFFFVVGLEIKREVLVGELASFRQAVLPLAAAAGGMIVPAVIYLLFNQGTEFSKGWAIPMATDIALTLGALTILGSRVPQSLVVFLVALAIADDLGAVIVIALFYTADISLYWLQLSGLVLIVLALINVLGYRNPLPYLILGLVLWATVYLSGMHSTLAGVLLALTIPARSSFDTDEFLNRAGNMLNEFECAGYCGYSMYTNEQHQAAVQTLESYCRGVQPPLIRIEYALHPWVVFLIVPLFGLANAGVHIEWSQLGATVAEPVSLGIVIGLFVGKQTGILTAAWLAVKTGLGVMPKDSTWGHVYGGATLCGIGFTMSLFIANLSFGGAAGFNTVRMAILIGSVLSCVVGMLALLKVSKGRSPEGAA